MHYIASTQTAPPSPIDYLPTTGIGWFDTFLLMFLAFGIACGIVAWFWNKFVGPKFKENIVDPIREFIYDVRNIKQKTNELAKDTAEVKEEVKNSHTMNLRHEMDERHDEQMKAIKDVAHEVMKVAQEISFVKTDVTDLHEKTDRIKDRAALSHKEVMSLREEQNNHADVHNHLREHDQQMEKRLDTMSHDVRAIKKKLEEK